MEIVWVIKGGSIRAVVYGSMFPAEYLREMTHDSVSNEKDK